MPETSIAPPVKEARPAKPVSEALLNEKVCSSISSLGTQMGRRGKEWQLERWANWCSIQWDRCLSSLLIRSSLGLSFGVVFSVLLFKRRAWPAWVGLGFGAGRAYEECNGSFLRTGKEGVRIQRP